MELTDQQFDRALAWTGPLTECAVITGMPWRRAWAYVSGHPVTIRPFLKSDKASDPSSLSAAARKELRKIIKKGGYSVVDLLKLRMSDMLLSAGFSGKEVQALIDGKIFHAASGRFFSVSILAVSDGINPPSVRTFDNAAPHEVVSAITPAINNGSCWTVLNLGSLFRELIERIVCHQERREYTVKTPGQQVREALSAIREKKLVQTGE
jgi:hypothetical protein